MAASQPEAIRDVADKQAQQIHHVRKITYRDVISLHALRAERAIVGGWLKVKNDKLGDGCDIC